MFERLRKSLGSFIEKVSTEELDKEKLSRHLDDLRISLLENDVAIEVIDKLCQHVETELGGVRVSRLGEKRSLIKEIMKNSLLGILSAGTKVDLLELARKKQSERCPLVIVFVGINGTGKTTTVGKVASFLVSSGFSVVMACADTYRAGAIEQLEIHARRLGVKVIRHEYGSDAASVGFDAINYAKAHGINTVLIDTAGRMETNRNLMDEMKKIVRVTSPDLVIFVGDALTGNDAVKQAEDFSRYVPIGASVLTKMDADAKGGSAVSVAYITKRPIIFMGTGQTYADLESFNPSEFIASMLEATEDYA